MILAPSPEPPEISFWVDIPPHPQPRPQVAMRGENFCRLVAGGGAPKDYKQLIAIFHKMVHATAYYADKSGKLNAWKRAVKFAVRPHVQADPMGGPVAVSIDFYLPRPKGHLSTFQGHPQLGHPKPSAPVHHLQTPDLDNLAKSTLDAITEMRLWEDDAQVVQLTTTKQWGENGGAAISITFMDD